jgi:hypothetical protein
MEMKDCGASSVQAFWRGCRCDGCREANRVYKREYHAKNREAINARQRDYAAEHRERDRHKVAANVRRWYHKNRARLLETGPTQHGTLAGYNRFGCRCDECRAVKSAWQRGEYVKGRKKDAA